MQVTLDAKINAMLWDIPESRRLEVVNKILTNASETFRNDDQLFIKALSSLKWYELTKLVGNQNVLELLTDSTIKKLFPVQRRNYYTNARRLLSKYTLPSTGQNS
jgi:hypothetical protein